MAVTRCLNEEPTDVLHVGFVNKSKDSIFQVCETWNGCFWIIDFFWGPFLSAASFSFAALSLYTASHLNFSFAAVLKIFGLFLLEYIYRFQKFPD